MTTYRAAVIGLGRMGSTFDDEMTRGGSIFLPYCHAPSYHTSPHVELVAGTDLHDEQRAIFGERWGLDSEHLYSDYREMLEKEDLDLVSVCTTARVRGQIVEDAARAGVRAIWAEKPISLTLEEADSMVQVCRQQGTALAINCARRWNPFFAEARRLIQEGELGQILQVTAYAQCGLSHNGSHAIDTLRYLAGGEVEWVFGEMESDEAAAAENDLMGNGYLAFDNGVRSYLRRFALRRRFLGFRRHRRRGTGALRGRSPGVRADANASRRSPGQRPAGPGPLPLAHAYAGHGADYCRRFNRCNRNRPGAKMLG